MTTRGEYFQYTFFKMCILSQYFLDSLDHSLHYSDSAILSDNLESYLMRMQPVSFTCYLLSYLLYHYSFIHRYFLQNFFV